MNPVAQTHNQIHPEAWLSQHGDALFAYALRYNAARSEAEDLVQDTLLAAWRNRDGFRGEASERTWLLGILKHKAADRARRVARGPDRADDENSDTIEARVFKANGSWREPPGRWGRDPLEQAQSEAFMRTLADCLNGIPAAQRETFLLRELDTRDAAAAGEALGVNTNHLYVLLHRARLRLRRCLESRWFDDEAQRP